MGALTKAVAPGLAGSAESGGSDLMHLILGSHAAGQGGMNPLLGLFGGIHSLASGANPHNPQTLGQLIQQMGLQMKPPETAGGAAKPGFGMVGPMMNPQVSQPQTAETYTPQPNTPPPVLKAGGGIGSLFSQIKKSGMY